MKTITPSKSRSTVPAAAIPGAPAAKFNESGDHSAFAADVATLEAECTPAPAAVLPEEPRPIDIPAAAAEEKAAGDRIQRSARLVEFAVNETRRDLINAARTYGIDRADKKGFADGYAVSEYLKAARDEAKEREVAAGSALEKAAAKQAAENATALATLFNALNTKGVQGLLFRIMRRLPETL